MRGTFGPAVCVRGVLMEKILVSACLCGFACRMDGKSRPDEYVTQLYREGTALPVCPEQEGGLPTPRDPAEQVGDRVLTRHGVDVTAQYREGARICLQKAIDAGCRRAILKSKSPSCGVGMVHNGRFDGGLVPGGGVFARMLKDHGIECMTEKDV